MIPLEDTRQRGCPAHNVHTSTQIRDGLRATGDGQRPDLASRQTSFLRFAPPFRFFVSVNAAKAVSLYARGSSTTTNNLYAKGRRPPDGSGSTPLLTTCFRLERVSARTAAEGAPRAPVHNYGSGTTSCIQGNGEIETLAQTQKRTEK